MRRAARVDRNQRHVTKVLRDIGATVQLLHTVGDGCPDMIVGFRGTNYLLEIKDGKKPPSRRQLTADERRWHDEWRGQKAVVNSADEALVEIGAMEAR